MEGIQDGKSGVYDKSTGEEPLVLLMDGAAVKRYLDQNPHISIQSKINMLNERLSKKLQEEFLGKGVKYTDEEKKAIGKAYRNRYGAGTWKGSSYRLYREFLLRQAEKGMFVEMPEREFDVYDLAALAYIYQRTRETEVISEAHHIVVDEAQDFGMMVWHCLDACVRGCTYTIMGDVSQNIHFGFGLNDWESLKKLLLTDSADHFDMLRKSYRNTIEISHFAAAILNHGRFFRYPSEPIIRHGKEPQVCSVPSEELLRRTADICRDWQERGLATIALICRTEGQARDVVKALSPLLSLSGTDLETAEFGSGVMVLPVEYTKGLEFDSVLILNPTREDYPVDDGHARLLYVAATRALHELCVLHTGNLTGLIADPVPEEAVPIRFPEDENSRESNPHSRTEIGEGPNTGRETEADTKTGTPGSGSRPRPRARAVIKPAVSHATPEHAKPQTSYTGKPAPKSAPAALRGTSEPDNAAPVRFPVQANKKASYEDRAEKKAPGVCPAFGTPVPDRELVLPGHTRADLTVRWVTKDGNGLRLQSRYGILRIRPVTAEILRISFAREGNRLTDSLPPLIAYDGTWRRWTCRETAAAVELATEKLFLRINKTNGSLCYCDREKKELLSEKEKEARLVEDLQDGWKRSRFFLKLEKKERVFALGGEGREPVSLRGVASYITPGEGSWQDGRKRPAFVCSDKGYGLLIPADGPVFFCDRPSGDTWLCADVRGQMEMYFIAGNRGELENACRFLCGRL